MKLSSSALIIKRAATKDTRVTLDRRALMTRSALWELGEHPATSPPRGLYSFDMFSDMLIDQVYDCIIFLLDNGERMSYLPR